MRTSPLPCYKAIDSRYAAMTYYHVLVELRDAPKKVRCIFSNLAAKELESKFLKPYRRGQRMLVGTEVIDTMAITSARIVETNHTSDVELQGVQQKSRREIDDINRRSESVVFISVGRGYAPEDIEEAGADITARFIDSPPGQGQSDLATRLLNHPWVVAIVGGVIVAGIAAWFGWG